MKPQAPFTKNQSSSEETRGEEARVRRRGNILILLALLAFIAFTFVVILMKFDVSAYRNITQEFQSQQEINEAQRRLQTSLINRNNNAGG